MSTLAWPAPLRSGDRVQLAATSSALDTTALTRLEAGIAELESWGLVVEPHPHPLRRWGHLAGDDQQRRGDLRPGAAALLACIRGGWGAARLLEHDAAAATAARWLLGFSDVTSLLWARQAAGISGGIHGPMVTSLAAEPDWSRQRLHDLLFGLPLPPLRGDSWTAGAAEGPLLVANLTVATHLLGTGHLPSLRGAVLVLEDVGEAPYRLDRMLTHWRLCGALQQLAAIGFGRFSGCDDPDDSLSAEAVLRERTADLGIPVLANLPVGHEAGNAALPIGVQARLDASAGQLELLAS
ncbi:MAG: LD-carboxypeptidase [Synechococcaceae bacterium WB4_1_0192]|jgi:muramoyltetrapeptide carboxypeptidase|nr:LD-carboxypeptidase [Synechococcaceae bacterium WB4_1_0192]